MAVDQSAERASLHHDRLGERSLTGHDGPQALPIKARQMALVGAQEIQNGRGNVGMLRVPLDQLALGHKARSPDDQRHLYHGLV